MGMLEKFGTRFADKGTGTTKDTYYKFKVGVNRIRVVGEMLEVRSHYLPGNAKRGIRGLCPQMAFEGDDKIMQMINCADWDVATETRKNTRTCPICQLHTLASKAVSSGRLNNESLKFYNDIKHDCREMTSFKVNIIDRDDPLVTVIENGAEVKRPGFKIASLSYTVAKSIYELSARLKVGVDDPDRGIDLEVTRTDTNGTTSYKVTPVFEGMSAKVTPLTAEERTFKLHDLKAIYGRDTDIVRVRGALHGDLQALLDKHYPIAAAAPAQTAPATVVEQPSTSSMVANDILADITQTSMREAAGATSVLDQFPATQTEFDPASDVIPF